MKYAYHIRLPGEFGTKSKAYRKKLITLLSENIRLVLLSKKSANPRFLFDIHSHFDHLEVVSTEPLQGVLEHIPGIYGYYPITIKHYQSVEEILDLAEAEFKEKIREKTFAVRVKVYEVKVSSRFLEREIGARLYPYARGVNLTQPEVTCSLILYPHQVSFYSEEIKGMGGFPIGTQRKALLLFSGGIDSPIAAWYLYRMGFELDYLFFDLGNPTIVQRAYDLSKLLHQRHNSGRKSRFFYVSLLSIIPKIQQNVERPFQNLALKWVFYKVANQIAKRHGIRVLATGESLGQVSTQTLESLTTLSLVSELPILRPLLFQVKTDILKQAHALGTYDLSYKGQEYCALAIRHVHTRPTLQSLQEALQSFPSQILHDLTPQIFYLHRDEPLPETLTSPSFTSVDQIIAVDLEPDTLPSTLQAKAHFYSYSRAWNECLHLNPANAYLIICPTGQRANLIANLMREHGFTHVFASSIHQVNTLSL
jgi:thiamine biosynthesis protein ThiI